MERIAIVGSPGCGKSTFAKTLADRTGITLYHLDNYYWRPGWVETPRDEWNKVHGALVGADRWIIDGTYANTIDARLARADIVISFHTSRLKCLYRVLRRSLTNYGKDVQAPGCPERIDLEFIKYVWDFPKVHQRKIEDAIAKNRATLRVIRVSGPHDLEQYL